MLFYTLVGVAFFLSSALISTYSTELLVGTILPLRFLSSSAGACAVLANLV
jgi:hypothetical protein